MPCLPVEGPTNSFRSIRSRRETILYSLALLGGLGLFLFPLMGYSIQGVHLEFRLSHRFIFMGGGMLVFFGSVLNLLYIRQRPAGFYLDGGSVSIYERSGKESIPRSLFSSPVLRQSSGAWFSVSLTLQEGGFVELGHYRKRKKADGTVQVVRNLWAGSKNSGKEVNQVDGVLWFRETTDSGTLYHWSSRKAIWLNLVASFMVIGFLMMATGGVLEGFPAFPWTMEGSGILLVLWFLYSILSIVKPLLYQEFLYIREDRIEYGRLRKGTRKIRWVTDRSGVRAWFGYSELESFQSLYVIHAQDQKNLDPTRPIPKWIHRKRKMRFPGFSLSHMIRIQHEINHSLKKMG